MTADDYSSARRRAAILVAHAARRRAAILVAHAAHIERNSPETFPQATIDRLEIAVQELLGDKPLSFETAKVLERMAQSVRARSMDRPGAQEVLEALEGAE